MNENSALTSNPYAPPVADLNIKRPLDKIELAGRGRRLAAIVIDTFIVTAATISALIIYYGGWDGYKVSASSDSLVSELRNSALYIAMYMLVNCYFLVKNAQSLGKRMLGIKVVRTDGRPVSFARNVASRVVFQNALLLVPVVDIFLWLIDVLFIFRRSRKCLHDKIADTIVVRI